MWWRVGAEGQSGHMARMVTHAYCRSSGLKGRKGTEIHGCPLRYSYINSVLSFLHGFVRCACWVAHGAGHVRWRRELGRRWVPTIGNARCPERCKRPVQSAKKHSCTQRRHGRRPPMPLLLFNAHSCAAGASTRAANFVHSSRHITALQVKSHQMHALAHAHAPQDKSHP